MNMNKVNSTSIDAIGYDQSTKKMYIKFKNNYTKYTFCNVPNDVYKKFLNSPYNNSHGKHYRKYIFKKYDCF